MGVRTGRFVAAAGLALAASVATGAPAGAQIAPPPLPVLPPLPEQTDPALLVLAPIASPACGNASLLAIAASGLVPVPGAGPLIGYAVSPAFVACANVPVPESSSELVCAQDDQFLAALSTVTFLVIGSGPPVAMRVVGPAVESATVLEAIGPDALAAAGLTGLLRDALACRVSRPVKPTPPTPSVADTPAADEAIPDLLLGDDATFGFGDIPSVTDTFVSDAGSAPDISPARTVAAARPFDYPVVFVLPLLLLAVGGYLARSLTEDVDLPS